MKIMFLQELTGGLFKGLLKNRLNGLFAKTPTVAVLFLTAIITACASGDPKSSDSTSPPSTTTPPPMTTANCMFAEDNGTQDCGLIVLPQVFNSNTTYNITVGEVGKGNTSKLGLGNFTFTQIIQGNISDPKVVTRTNDQIELLANATALNLNISGIDDNVFGEFYIELVKSDDASVKVRYTISITAVNDAPVFSAVRGSESQFTPAAGATPTRYRFAGIPLNSFIGYSVGNVSASDAENNTVTYSIENEDIYPLFLINPMTGEITLRALADAEALYTFNVIATDDKGGSTRTDITVSVLPDNQAPMFSASSYTFTGILHNSPLGYSVGNVSVTDPDLDTITYSISGEDDDIALFNISSTGEITLIAEATVGVYAFNVNATDGNNGIATATIFVTVIDPTAPVFTETPYNFVLSLSEANAQDVVVGNVSAEDIDGTDFDYSLVSSGDVFDDLFGLAAADNADGNRGIILLRTATLSDFAVPSITFQVVATHQVGGTSSEPANITVNLNNDLELDDDFDGDGVKGFYDAFPHDATMNITGNGEPNDPYNITNIYQLQAIAGVDHRGTALDLSVFTNYTFLYGTDAADQLTKHYMLANDINASATVDTAVWTKLAVTGYIGHGWTPIAGKSGQSFSGSFSGEGYAISNLNMSLRAATLTDTFGLFGTSSGNISAVGLENIEMRVQSVQNRLRQTTGNTHYSPNQGSGGLVGKNEQGGIIQYSYVSGLVNATANRVGGVVGFNLGEISYSYSTAAVEGRLHSGGLVGHHGNSESVGNKVSSSYATGAVRGDRGHPSFIINSRGQIATAGGLVGLNANSGVSNIVITASYATGVVSDQVTSFNLDSRLGAFVGGTATAGIATSYWYNNSAFPNIKGAGYIGNNVLITSTSLPGISNTQLQGCGLGGVIIEGASPVPTTCMGLFPSSDWGNTTDSSAGTFDIERGWIFNAGEYPSLSAVRSSDDKQLFPSAAQQECHRNGMPLDCE